MRKLFFILLLMLALPALLFSTLEVGSGYVLIALGETTIEMGFLVALLLNILAFIAIYASIALLRALFSTRRGVLGWAKNQRQQRGLNRTTQGLIAFVEGRWDFARKSLDKAAGNASTPLVNYLFAARASSAMGDAKAVDTYLKQAELSTEGADVAIGLTQAELQIHNGQYEQALATLLRAKKQASHHPVVLNLLAEVYQQLSDWDSLHKLLPALRKYNAMPVEAIKNLEQTVCCAKLGRAANDGAEAMIACWKHLPNEVRKNPQVLACYAEHLIELDSLEEAERVLRAQLHRQYDSDLVRLYGLAGHSAAEKQLAFANKLAKSHSDDPVLSLTLARIHLRQNNQDEARESLHQSIAAGPLPEACAELAALYAQSGDDAQSAKYYAQALALFGNKGKHVLLVDNSQTVVVSSEKVSSETVSSQALPAAANADTGSEREEVSAETGGEENKSLFSSTDELSKINVR